MRSVVCAVKVCGHEVAGVARRYLNQLAALKSVGIHFENFPFFNKLIEVGLHGPFLEGGSSKLHITIDSRSGQCGTTIFQKLKDQTLSVLLTHIVAFRTGHINLLGSDMFAGHRAKELCSMRNCTISCKVISGRGCLSDEHGYHWVPNWAENRPGPAPARQPGDGHARTMTTWNPLAGGQKAGERSVYSTQTTTATRGGQR